MKSRRDIAPEHDNKDDLEQQLRKIVEESYEKSDDDLDAMESAS